MTFLRVLVGKKYLRQGRLIASAIFSNRRNGRRAMVFEIFENSSCVKSGDNFYVLYCIYVLYNRRFVGFACYAAYMCQGYNGNDFEISEIGRESEKNSEKIGRKFKIQFFLNFSFFCLTISKLTAKKLSVFFGNLCNIM